MSTTRVSRHIRASPAHVYRALLDADAVRQWMVPDAMTSHVHVFEPREHGALRISLTYDALDGAGKTDDRTDTFHGRFARLVPDREVVQVLAFESDDPAMQGEMTITYTLTEVGGGTDIVGVHEGVPAGVSPADNTAGWQMSLARLARLVELTTITIDAVDPASAVARHAMGHYFAELDARFHDGFDAIAAGTAADVDSLRSPDGVFMVMSSGTATIGCGGVQRIDDRTGEIKRMWIHADWRRMGLGQRMLARLEDAARALGRTRAILDTNETLREAVAMYERAGYRAIERYNDNPYAHHWFAKDL